MVGRIGEIRQESVLLKDDSIGVETSNKTRKVQKREDKNMNYITLDSGWLKQLNLEEQGSQTVHSVSMGVKPVIVQNPAIIIQPADVVLDTEP